MLTREQILAVTEPMREVDVPSWGGSVFIKQLTVKERLDLAESIKDEPEDLRKTLTMLVWTLHDQAGNRIFTDADIDALASKGGATILRLADEAMRCNGMAPDSIAEAEKN